MAGAVPLAISALTTAGIGVVLWFPLQSLFDREGMNLWVLLGLWILAIGVGIMALIGGCVLFIAAARLLRRVEQGAS